MTKPALIRPDRGHQMDAFLTRIGWDGATRHMLAGDASFRRYERVEYRGTIAVLMDAPPPWEDVRPFQAVTVQLADFGLTVPTILAADEVEGFLLLEDLGDVSFTRLLTAEPTREREIYGAATDALIALYRASQTGVARLAQTLKPYDHAVYLREAALFAEWFLPQLVGIEQAQVLRREFLAIWQRILTETPLQQTCLTHRDYHADNLFWLNDRLGHSAVGMIDYQDALLGDPAYDLASLLEDARRDVAQETAQHCLAVFAEALGESAVAFSTRYAVLAAQRNAKIIGIFARLAVRDGKAHYTHYLPRVWAHFTRDLAHPQLAALRAFVDHYVPVSARGALVMDVSVGGIVV